MAHVLIGLGSNLGHRQGYLESAVEKVRQLPETTVLQVSSWIETKPHQAPPGPDFLNAIAALETQLSPPKLLEGLQAIEVALGRAREHAPLKPRTIDLDLLTYENLILEIPGLSIPHPRMHTRPFVLIPLKEIAPDWKHPILHKTAQELLDQASHANYPENR